MTTNKISHFISSLVKKKQRANLPFSPSSCRMEKIKSKQKGGPAAAGKPALPADQEQVTLGNTSESISCFYL